VAPLPLGAGYWATGRRVACRLPLWPVAAAARCGRPAQLPADRLSAWICVASAALPVEQRAAGCLVGMHDVV